MPSDPCTFHRKGTTVTTTSTPTSTDAAGAAARPRGGSAPRTLRWRTIDIVVAAVLGVACGLVFMVWNSAGFVWMQAMEAITPGLKGIAVGIWLLGGVLGGLVIRKPGAALFVELLAACVSALLGAQWGIEVVYMGLAQGLGAELLFAALRYRRFSLPVAMLAGAAASIGTWCMAAILSGNVEKGLTYNVVYLATLMLSGAVLAGLVGWLLTRALATTGALDRLASGRAAQRV